MDLKKFILIRDGFLPLTTISKLIKVANSKKFDSGKLIGNTEDHSIRKTNVYPLSSFSDSLTDVHWANFLTSKFSELLRYYDNLYQTDSAWNEILDISILKYQETGHYKYHVDHHASIPRTFSIIVLLNDDYEGGELVFTYPGNLDKEELIVKPKAGKVIVWPSNFLYPHKVKPIIKGTRFSIVSWAL